MFTDDIVLFQLLYIIPSILLYILEIYAMFFGSGKSKFNKSSFNKLFVIYAVNNIIADLMYYFFLRMVASPIFFGLLKKVSGCRTFLGILWQLLLHTSIVTNSLDLILSLNRLTVILTSMRFKTFWNGKIKWVIIFIIIFPYICFWYFPFQGIDILYDDTLNRYRVSIPLSNIISWPLYPNIVGGCVAISCIGCFFTNAYIGFKLHYRKNIVINTNDQLETVHFAFMICVFITQILSISTQVVFFQHFQN